MLNRKELLIGGGSVVLTACAGGGPAESVPSATDSARTRETSAGSSDGRVSSVALATSLVAPTTLAMDGDNVVVGGEIMYSVPAAGGALKELAEFSHRVQRIAVCEGDIVVGLELGDWHTRIAAVSSVTGQSRSLATVHGGSLCGVVGETVYFGERFSYIFGMPVIGDGVRARFVSQVWPVSVTTDDIALVYQNWWTKSVYRIIAGTAAPVLLIPGRGVAGQVVTNDTYAFLSAAATIVKARKTGDGPVTVLYASSRENPRAIACNQDFVFFTEGHDVRAISVAGGMARTLVSDVRVVAAAAGSRGLYILTDERGSGALYRIDFT